MKKLILSCIFLCLMVSIFALVHVETFQKENLDPALQNTRGGNRVVESRNDGLILEWSVNEMAISERNVDVPRSNMFGYTFTNLEIEGFVGSNQVGLPELPYMGRLITVPVNAEVKVNVLDSQITKLSLNDLGFTFPVYPTQPSYTKSTDLKAVDFHFDALSYQLADFDTDWNVFKIHDAGFMRGQRIFEVIYTPVRYNPLDNTLEVHDYLLVELVFENADFAQTEYLHQKTWSAEFEKLFQYNLLNYSPPKNRNELIRIPTKYVIVSFPAFIEAMQPFIEWKTKQGYEIILVSTADPEVGNTTTSIKNFLQNLWNAATPEDPAPSYLLLVGDTPQIPPWNSQASPSDHITDLHYVRLEGTNFFPDMYYGRFSAQNIEQLMPYIDKNLMYQMFTMPDPSYLGRSINVAGHDSYWSPTHANGQVNYLSSLYMNQENGYHTPYVHLYPQSSQQASQIRQRVSEGLSWATYTAHGQWDQWGDPYFHVSHVYALENYGMYPVVIGNTCLTSRFQQPECFAEAWLRAPDKGGVLYIGGTNSTYWNEDFWFTVGHTTPLAGGVPVPYNPNQLGQYDMLFHTHGEPVEKWHTTAGAMIFGGNMVVQGTSSSLKNYYWEIYCIMGDPSLTPYLGMPEQNPAEFTDIILMGMDELIITNSAPFARVALSKDGVLVGAAFTDEFGVATLQFSPFAEPGDALLVITAQKHEPIIETIQVLPANMPFLVFENVVNPHTGNNTADFASESQLALSIKNLGMQPAQNVIFEITTNSEFVVIEKDNIFAEIIPADIIFDIDETFIINIVPFVKDQTIAEFSLKANMAGEDIWTTTFEIFLNAPNIEVNNYEITDMLGETIYYLQPGETAQMLLLIENTGAATSFDGNIMIVSSNPYVSIEYENSEILPINPSHINEFSLILSIDENIPVGSLTNIAYFIDFTHQIVQGFFPLSIGIQVESFESGDFNAMPWTHTSLVTWTIDSQEAYQGQYSARSGNITDNQTSVLQISLPLAIQGSISFALKTSTEPNNDRLEFYLNNTVLGSWSGETDWRVVEYNIPIGDHNLRWVYRKNGSISMGEDSVWIDHIVFPAGGGGHVYKPIVGTTIEEIDFGHIQINDFVETAFHLINFGNRPLEGTLTLPESFYLNTGKGSDFFINPSESVEYIISYVGLVDGLFQGNIQINSNDTDNPVLNIPLQVAVGVLNDDDKPILPLVTKLKGNYPNPFNPSTTISFDLANEGHVRIDVFNIRGQRIRVLTNDFFPVGSHNIDWNGQDENGHDVSSGVYFYRMSSNDSNDVRRMVLLK
ncbi:MAG: C25 family cysteine peptidase [Candidatus Cloacimonetes bacterium]|nr:C25 family cysteine peptidase [Candidatus Cloacimonadota bacterium]